MIQIQNVKRPSVSSLFVHCYFIVRYVLIAYHGFFNVNLNVKNTKYIVFSWWLKDFNFIFIVYFN